MASILVGDVEPELRLLPASVLGEAIGVSGVAVKVFSKLSLPVASVVLEVSEVWSMGPEALEVS